MAKRGRKALTPNQIKGQLEATGLWSGFHPPKTLDEPTLAEYHTLVSNLKRVGTLDRTAPNLVVLAARMKIAIDGFWDQVAIDGPTQEGSHGGMIPHPLLQSINQMTIRLRGLYHDMGLTANSSKHGSPEKKETTDSGWGDLLSVHG